MSACQCLRSQPIASTSKTVLTPRSRRAASTAQVDWLVRAARQAVSKVDDQKALQETAFRRRRAKLRATFGSLGSTQTIQNAYKAHHTLTEPVEPGQIALDHILASTLHLGHSKRFHDRHATGFVYGRRYGQDIIDARQTLAALRRAAEVVRGIVENDGAVAFMGSLNGTEQAIRNAAAACGANGFAITKYKEGFLTDAERVYDGYNFTDPIKTMSGGGEDRIPAGMLIPALLVLLTPRMHTDAIAEANITRIPTIGLIDSDTDPRLVTYAIPGNDDSPRGIQLIAGLLGRAGREGLERRLAKSDPNWREPDRAAAEIKARRLETEGIVPAAKRADRKHGRTKMHISGYNELRQQWKEQGSNGDPQSTPQFFPSR